MRQKAIDKRKHSLGADVMRLSWLLCCADRYVWSLQMVVEKVLREEGQSRLGMGREAFEERVWQWKAEYGGFITQQMRQMGASCDWSRERFTLDSQLSGAPARNDSPLINLPAVLRTAQPVPSCSRCSR